MVSKTPIRERSSCRLGDGSAIINKNNEAWRSFLALKRLEAEGKPPPYTNKVSMPICWKRNGRRELSLFYCPKCRKAMNADAVGALNIVGKDETMIPSPSWRDRGNGLMAEPLLLRWNGMKWEPERAMNSQPTKALEAGISRLQPWRVSRLN